MRQANNVKSKMASMMTCIKGLDAFSGTGTKRFDNEGAQQGFCHKTNVGFCLASRIKLPPFHDDAQTRPGIEAREQGRFYKPESYELLSDEAKAMTSVALTNACSKVVA
eukprot:g10112.t2